MKKVNDWTLMVLVMVFVAVGFVLGAVWHSHVDPEVYVVPDQHTVTPATSAPPTVASVQP